MEDDGGEGQRGPAHGPQHRRRATRDPGRGCRSGSTAVEGEIPPDLLLILVILISLISLILILVIITISLVLIFLLILLTYLAATAAF